MVRVKTNTTRSNTTNKKPQNKLKDPVYALYQKYIKSKEFKELREKVLNRDNYRCKFCGRTLEEIEGTKLSLQAHHSDYRNLGKCNEDEMADIITLCSVCHKSMHSAPSNLRRFTDKTPIINNYKQP